MTRNQQIGIYGGLVAVPLSYFMLSYVNRRVRFNKLAGEIAGAEGGTSLPDIAQDDAFDPQYWKGATIPITNYYILSPNEIIKYREQLYHSMHGGTGWGTDEDEMLGVFRSLRDKVALSQVADSYQMRYGYDLYSDIMGELESDDIYTKTQIGTIVDNKLGYTPY